MQDWHKAFSELPDRCTGENVGLNMADIGLSAFAVFFTQCPSFLSFQQNMEKASGLYAHQPFCRQVHHSQPSAPFLKMRSAG